MLNAEICDSALLSSILRARQGRAEIEAASLRADEAMGDHVEAGDAARFAAALDAYDVALADVCDAIPNTDEGLRAKLRWLADSVEDLTFDLIRRFAQSCIEMKNPAEAGLAMNCLTCAPYRMAAP